MRPAGFAIITAPERRSDGVETAVAAWAALRRLAGGSAKVHLTGGEPFWCSSGCWRLRTSGSGRMGGADYVETNAGWVTDQAEARRRLKALDVATCSAQDRWDIFHEEFIPVEKVRF